MVNLMQMDWVHNVYHKVWSCIASPRSTAAVLRQQPAMLAATHCEQAAAPEVSPHRLPPVLPITAMEIGLNTSTPADHNRTNEYLDHAQQVDDHDWRAHHV